MSGTQRRWAFKASMILDAPDHAGVYALWRYDDLLEVGVAGGGGDTIRGRLIARYWATQPGAADVPTHYTWEISNEPERIRQRWLADLQLPAEGRAA